MKLSPSRKAKSRDFTKSYSRKEHKVQLSSISTDLRLRPSSYLPASAVLNSSA